MAIVLWAGIVELGLEGEVEGLERGPIREVSLFETAADSAFPPIVELCAQESLERLERLGPPCSRRRARARSSSVEGSGRGEAVAARMRVTTPLSNAR